jgi:hypothetical protein
MARTTRRLVTLVVVGVVILAASAQGACVLAQPSGDVPRLPESRPTIIHPLLTPSTSSVLTYWPPSFGVPVELVDPTVPFWYVSFVDYNPNNPTQAADGPRSSLFDVSNTTDRTRNLTVTIPAPLDLDRCHVIEVIVALRLNATTDPKNQHTPDAPGGDIATWFYNPSGTTGGCPSQDAGISVPLDDDAGEAGTQ